MTLLVMYFCYQGLEVDTQSQKMQILFNLVWIQKIHSYSVSVHLS